MTSYKFKLEKDKKGFYIVFSKVFSKEYKLKKNQIANIIVTKKHQFLMKLGKNEFLCKIK